MILPKRLKDKREFFPPFLLLFTFFFFLYIFFSSFLSLYIFFLQLHPTQYSYISYELFSIFPFVTWDSLASIFLHVSLTAYYPALNLMTLRTEEVEEVKKKRKKKKENKLEKCSFSDLHLRIFWQVYHFFLPSNLFFFSIVANYW